MNINRIKKNIKKVEEIVESIDVQDVINRMEKDKENSIEELKQELEELYRTQQARLDAGADDLDIREEIAEVEEEIKELQDETIEENSIEEDIEILESIIKINNDYLEGIENQTINQKEIKALEHILLIIKKYIKLEKLQKLLEGRK